MQEGAHAMRRERVCLPERCRAPQYGGTPLHVAVWEGHDAVVEKLLALGAAKDATDKVRVGGGMRGQDREGSMGNAHLFMSF